MNLIRQKQKCTETSQVASIFVHSPIWSQCNPQTIGHPQFCPPATWDVCQPHHTPLTRWTLQHHPIQPLLSLQTLTNKSIFSQSQALEVQKATVQIYLQTKVQMRSWACKGFCFGNCIEPKPIYSLYLNICVFIMKLCLFIKNINYVLFLKNKKHIYNLV